MIKERADGQLMEMKPNTYYLFVNGKIAKYSGSLDELLKYTTKAYKPEIIYNGETVWKK